MLKGVNKLDDACEDDVINAILWITQDIGSLFCQIILSLQGRDYNLTVCTI